MGVELVPIALGPQPRERALVALNAGGSLPPLFCIHARAGHLRLFADLAAHLGPGQPVYGLQGVLCDEPAGAPYRRFEEMAARYVRELREFQRGAPYLILGECDGGGLALEVARALTDCGERVALLALVDSFPPPGDPPLRSWVSLRSYRAMHWLRMLGFHLATVARLEPPARSAYVVKRTNTVVGKLKLRVSGQRPGVSADRARQEAFQGALSSYRPGQYRGPAILFRASKLPWGSIAGRDLGWGRHLPELVVVELSGYFGTTMLEPSIRRLAQALGARLEALRPVPRDQPH